MSSPVAVPSDLETYLNITPGTIDQVRATQLLLFAQLKCERIIYPCPSQAIDIVCQAAARAYSNPEGVLTETVGPYTVQRGSANVFLTRYEMADLRRMSGRGGAFSIETLPQGTSAVQMATIQGDPTGGTWTLTFYDVKTAPLAYNASATAVQASLEALTTIQAGNVAVYGSGGSYTITFQNDLATTPVPTMTADGSNLTGGTNPSATVVVLQEGVYAPGQNLAPWDRDYFSENQGLLDQQGY